MPCLLRAVMVVLLTVGAGLCFWKTHGKKEMEAGTGRLHISFRPNPFPPHGALCPFVPFSLHGGGVAVALAFMVEGGVQGSKAQSQALFCV